MRTRTPMRVLLTIALTLALLPMLSTFAPGGQVAGFTTASPAVADQIWYQSVGRASATAACEKSTTTELAAGWTDWAPSWAKWVNGGNGGFVCNRHITWAFDSVPFSCAAGAGAAGTCVLGATGPGGGIVFYVNEAATTGARYMEAALSGWNTGADPALLWGVNTGGVDCSTLNIAGAVGTAIGTGRDNTNAITTACTAAQAPAAWAARNYTGGGLATGSWFLPSQDELNQLFLQRAVVGGFAADDYWSSSLVNANDAWSQDFVNGSQSNDDKGSSAYRVRPVRAF
jgi:hypothetical protein